MPYARNIANIRIRTNTYQRLKMFKDDNYKSWDEMINSLADLYEFYAGQLPRPSREEMLNKIKEMQNKQRKR